MHDVKKPTGSMQAELGRPKMQNSCMHDERDLVHQDNIGESTIPLSPADSDDDPPPMQNGGVTSAFFSQPHGR
eukprot:1113534-Karenia_brevis.AAC.1